ncbi:MAG TPA: DUF3352 domain-containing protein [Nocardioidaceae bacterium]|nr:DUF3352 domain-containing protein [Nocardioidaceae bacterium]
MSNDGFAPPSDGGAGWSGTGGWAGSEPERLAGPGGPGGPTSHSRRSPRGTKVAALVAVLVVLIGGGAFAFYRVDPLHLFRAGPQAAEAVPSDAIAYVGVDLDPSAQQKIAALRFLTRFPGFTKATKLTDANSDIRKSIANEILGDCPGLSYAADVEPWLGSKLGMAVLPGRGRGAGSPSPFALLQVTDQAAAQRSLGKLTSCLAGRGGTAAAHAFVDGYLVLGATSAQTQRYVADLRQGSLAASTTFQADMAALGTPGVASAWADLSALTRLTHQPDLNPALALNSSYRRAAATLRFGSGDVQLVTAAYGGSATSQVVANPVVHLPASTMAALSVSGGEKYLDSEWPALAKRLKGQGVDLGQTAAMLRAETGLSLPSDLATLLGQNLLVAVDRSGATAATLRSGNFQRLSIGARFTNDPGSLDRVYAKIVGLFQQSGGRLPLVKRDFPDGISVASNAGYAESLGRLQGDLGDSADFKSVVDNGASQQFVLYVDFATIRAQVLAALQDSGAPPNAVDNLRPLRALGVTGSRHGQYLVTTVTVSAN